MVMLIKSIKARFDDNRRSLELLRSTNRLDMVD